MVVVQEGQGHLAVVGVTGSGKTLLQRLLWRSVIPRLGPGQRALIYDAKQDTCALLKGMGVTPVLLNPLDARSVAWNLAADITTPTFAFQVASLLIPDTSQDANPFFTNSSRLLLYGALLTKRRSLRLN